MYNEIEDSFNYSDKNNIRLLFLKNNRFKYKYNSHKGIKSKQIIERNTTINSYFTTNKHASTSNTNTNISQQESYLLKKLNNLLKINRELNTQLKNISEKSQNLLKEISENKSKYLLIKKDYENEIKTNKSLKLQLKNALINYEKEKEINEIREEQNILEMTLKSKDKILNNLNNSLNSINKEIEDDKKINENIIKEKDKQIQELKKILEQLSNKYEENKNYIETIKKKKEEEKNKNKLSKNNIPVQKENKIEESNNISQNNKNNKNNLSIQIKNNNNRNQNNTNNSHQHLSTITEKADNNSEDSEKSLFKLSSIIIHRKTKSKEIFNNQYLEDKDIDSNIYSYSEGNTIKTRTKSNEKNKDSFYLYTITKEGILLEYDLMEKKYQKINTSQIKDWNLFISEYSSYNEGSALLNTFQGLFILTGKDYKNLYYYSEKYNSISKIKKFNFGHKYGALILTPNSENIIAIGGDTKQVELLNIETGKIQILPTLLTKRINSAYSFIDGKLFAFFGKRNYQIEYLNITNSKKWELFNLIKNENKLNNEEGLSAIVLNKNDIVFLGNINNNKVMIFNYIKRKIEYKDISIQSKNKFNKYKFDKDKYFNNFINFEKIGKDGNYLNQFVGIDSVGNIHYFNNDFSYSIINNENI